MAFDVSTITGYVQANEKSLIGKAVIGGKTALKAALQTGIKGSAKLNNLTADPSIQAGGCGWSSSGTTAITNRELKTGLCKVNETFCEKDLVGTFMEYDVKIAAGQKTLPFEEMFIEQNLKAIAKKNDDTIWNGVASGSTGTHLDRFDGFVQVLSAESSVINASVSGKTLSGDTKLLIENVVASMPDEIQDRDDLVIFTGIDIYRKYVKALQDANLYHYAVNPDPGAMELMIPGTNVTLVGVYGLTGKDKAYGSFAENFVIGTDLEGDAEKFDFWYSVDNREFRLAVDYNMGVQVRFPDLVAYGYDA